MSDDGRRNGGVVRAQRLAPEERSRIASEAAKARWSEAESLPKATHRGELTIGDTTIPCAVLDDGRRVITEHGITSALGSRSGASKRLKRAAASSGTQVPVFLAPTSLKPFIADDLIGQHLAPVLYRDGRRVVAAYDANALPAVCDVWLRAREAGALQAQQADRAQRAEMLMRGLARVGIVALVDEATGFQVERERDALHKLLSVYLSEERLAWAKRFPDEFYRQVYRLRGWPWPVTQAKTPLLGRITNDVVYDRLPPGVLPKLQQLNPTSEVTGRRRFKHHQFLSPEVGQPDLRDHLLQIIPIMRISRDWDSFKGHLDIAFPKTSASAAGDD